MKMNTTQTLVTHKSVSKLLSRLKKVICFFHQLSNLCLSLHGQPEIQIQKVIQVFLVSLSLILVCVRPSGSNKKQSRDVNPSQEIVSWVVAAVTCETYNLFFAVSLLLHHPPSQGPFIYYVAHFLTFWNPSLTYVSMILVLKISKKCYFNPKYLCLRNMYMNPQPQKQTKTFKDTYIKIVTRQALKNAFFWNHKTSGNGST